MIRFFDVLFSLLALFVLSPILALSAIILRFTGEGEVIFMQRRVGMHGRDFGLIKFATMLKDSPDIGAGTITLNNDPRVLPVGRFLRKTKINELPQILNVLVGDMSLVGPRPLTRENFDYYSEEQAEIIASVPPGLSGYGSLFFRNEQMYLDGMDAQEARRFYGQKIASYKGALEEAFVEQRSLYVYVVVILLTVIAIAAPKVQLIHRFLKLPEIPSYFS